MKAIKYIVRDKNRLMLDKQTDRQFSAQTRRLIHNGIFNMIHLIPHANTIFWDLLGNIFNEK